MILLALIPLCTAHVAPVTISAVVQVESRGEPNAVNINGVGFIPTSGPKDATARATAAIAQGYTVDMGLMQVNSKTAARYGYTVEQMFDPCTNLAIGAKVLQEDYLKTRQSGDDEQVALSRALSLYNTGSSAHGFDNGYVGKYYDHAPRGRTVGPDRYSVSQAIILPSGVSNAKSPAP